MERSSCTVVKHSVGGRSSPRCARAFIEADLQELIVPSLAEQATFVQKAGPEVLGQMYCFKDKGDRDLCLIPEVTGVVQELWNDGFFKGPTRLFYVSRCYRYERPQKGRYREFTQMGVEFLGGSDQEACIDLLRRCLDAVGLKGYALNDSVTRGLAYYTEEGFEVECSWLGAQKQVAGGGQYKEGIGWAIGLDRLLLALE